VKAKLKFLVPIMLVLIGGVYKTVLAKEPVKEKHKVEGEVYVLPKEFLVNLSDGRFAKLGLGLVFEEGFHAAPETGGHGAAPKPPEGFGVLVQEPLVRDIVTDVLTDARGSDLTERKGRKALKQRIERRLRKHTDVKVHHVLFTDVAVQ
jgi:flagellar basal body-associated protein FliL